MGKSIKSKNEVRPGKEVIEARQESHEAVLREREEEAGACRGCWIWK